MTRSFPVKLHINFGIVNYILTFTVNKRGMYKNTHSKIDAIIVDYNSIMYTVQFMNIDDELKECI